MVTFTPRPGAPEPDEEPAITWLRETLERLAPERDMPAGTTWEIHPGAREAGRGIGLRLRQTGYQITAVHASGRVYRLTCFVGDDDALEEELRPTLEQVLSLWPDRL